MKAKLFLLTITVSLFFKSIAQLNSFSPENYFKSDSVSFSVSECSEKATKKKVAACRVIKMSARIHNGSLLVRIDESLTRDTTYLQNYKKIAHLNELDFLSPKIDERTYTDVDLTPKSYFILQLNTKSNQNVIKTQSFSNALGTSTSNTHLISLYFYTKENAKQAIKYLEDKLKEESKPKIVLPLTIYQGTNKKYGLKDAKGVVVLEASSDYLFKNNLGYFVVQSGNKRGLYNQQGKELIPIKYDYLVDFSENLLQVKLNSKYGYVDSMGNEIIPLTYDDARKFKNGIAPVQIGLKWGAIDKKNTTIIPFDYTVLEAISDTILVFQSGNQFGLVSNKNKIILPALYTSINYWDGFPAVVELNGKFGLIDQQGKVIVQPKYDLIKYFNNGYVEAEINKKKCLIDSTGKQVCSAKYDYIGGFFQDRAIVNIGGKMCYQDAGCWEGGKWGFIDKTGKEVVPLMYSAAHSFSDGLAAVMNNNKWGFIDLNGKIIIPLIYEQVEGFMEGSASVKKGDEYFSIDKTGKRID